jgi:type II secretory pathway pseudopilin PulG/tetratricopeptide (TPR) repeat protein
LSASPTFLSAAVAGAEETNPCRAAVAECRAGDKFLDITYRLDLDNPTDATIEAVLLTGVDVVEKAEGVKGQLVLDRQDGTVRAGVPPKWRGRVALLTKQRIIRKPGETAVRAEIPMPPALSRTIEADLPGRRIDLKVSPDAVVHTLEAEGDRSRFRIIPLQGNAFTISWQQVAPARAPSYGLRQLHHVTEYVTEFSDDVALEFAFADSPPAAVSAGIPNGVAVTSVEASANALWKVVGEALEVRVPADFTGDRLTVTCHLDGATSAAGEEGARLLTVPLFTSPGAERHEGRVLVAGGAQELSFITLDGASQAAAEGDRWRLACEFRTDAAKVVAKIVPMVIPAHATIQSDYVVSAFAVEGAHRITVGDRLLAIPSLDIVLPAGHFVRAAKGSVPLEWSQKGVRLQVRPARPLSGSITVEVTTECLTGDGRRAAFTPPVVAGVSSSDYAVGIKAAANVQLKTAGEAEAWRVPPETLPEWLKARSPAIGYRYQRAAAATEVEVMPIETEIAGSIQDHATVLEDRIRRETLFLLEITKRPVEQLVVLLPSGLVVERVDGPGIEGWGLSPDGAELTVRFAGPIQGPCHFQLISGQQVGAERLALHGILLRAAPQLKGWVGIGSDVSVAVKPVEDGRMNLGSVRTDRAPAYLKAFDNKLLYEFYESAWQLDLLKEGIPPVYVAETLNVFGFRAGEAEASALFKINVQQGGLGALDFDLPPGAASPRFSGPPAVLSQQEGSVWHVRFQGKRTGAISCRIDYSIVSGSSPSEIQLLPVRLRGAKEETGVVLLTQARTDAEAKLGAVPQALVPADAEQSYPAWTYTREQPALAAFTYRGTEWKLPVALTTHPLSEVLLTASIPLAKLDTLMETGKESLNHLRLYVANTGRQFLTVDLAKLGPQARLIGTYVYGEPVKPFREKGTVLELPLFTSEKAARLGMSVLDITYSTPQPGLAALRKQSLALPDLGLNVGEVDWTVRLPQGYRLAAVGGSMGKPATQAAAARSLAGMLFRLLTDFANANWDWGVALAITVALCAGIYWLARWIALAAGRRVLNYLGSRPVAILVLVVIIAILAGLLMPSLRRASEEARRSDQRANLHNVGLGIAMHRNAHNGAFPGSLKDLLSEGYVDDSSIFEWPGQELVYRPPDPKAPGSEVVAYFWPPVGDGVNVLFNDGAVQYQSADDQGNVINPRNGQLIANAPAAGRGAPAKVLSEVRQFIARAPAAVPVMYRARRMAQIASQSSSMHNVGLAIAMYRKDHNGAFPPTLQTLLSDRYISDPSLLEWEGQQIVYQPLGLDAPEKATMAYYWPPAEGAQGVNVLFNDQVVQWVTLDNEGRLVNPRNGEFIARAPAAVAYGAPAPKAFAGLGYEAREMKQAMEMQAQMGAQAPLPPEKARQQAMAMDQALLEAHGGEIEKAAEQFRKDHKGSAVRSADDLAPYIADADLRRAVKGAMEGMALLEAHREEIEKAVEQFRKDHNGNEPSSADDLAPYIPDADLRSALKGAMERMPALSRGGEEARRSGQRANLHNIGLGLQMYRSVHGGKYPSDLEEVLKEGYLDDREVLRWPGLQLRYAIPKTDREGDATAYFWSPRGGGANVLFQDNSVAWVQAQPDGQLVNPRTGELIASGEAAAGEAAKKEAAPDRHELAVGRYNLGLAYQQRGDYRMAGDNFRRALELEPGYDNPRVALGDVEALRQATAQQKPPAGAPGGVGRAAAAGPEMAYRMVMVPPAAVSEERADLKALADRLQAQEGRLEAAARMQDAFTAVSRRPEEVAQPAVQAPVQAAQPRVPKASLVKAVGGGRSTGALPITIDFPTPDTSSYDFVKPFLGKAEATVSFRPLSRQAAMLIELALAVCAVIGYLVIRALRPAGAVGFAGGALALAVALYFASSPPIATFFVSTAFAMALCLAGEAASIGVSMIRQNRGEVK